MVNGAPVSGIGHLRLHEGPVRLADENARRPVVVASHPTWPVGQLARLAGFHALRDRTGTWRLRHVVPQPPNLGRCLRSARGPDRIATPHPAARRASAFGPRSSPGPPASACRRSRLHHWPITGQNQGQMAPTPQERTGAAGPVQWTGSPRTGRPPRSSACEAAYPRRMPRSSRDWTWSHGLMVPVPADAIPATSE